MLISNKHIILLYQLELIALAFFLPIYGKVIPYIITVLIITWLVEADFVAKARRIVNSRHRQNILLFSVIYILYFIGMLYSGNINYGLFDLEVKLSLFIFPVIFASMREEVFSADMAKKVLAAFVWGVFTSVLLCLSVATVNYIRTGNKDSFFYGSLALLIHSSYFALYVSFAVTILLNYFDKGLIRSKFRKVLIVMLILLFEAFVVLLSSKAGIIGFVIIIFLFTIYKIFIKKQVLIGFVSGGVLMALLVVFLVIFPKSTSRLQQFGEAMEEVSSDGEMASNAAGVRLMIWWYSFEITNNNFLAGVGTGDVKDELLQKYEEKDLERARTKELNAHNQYLQTFIALGVIGLVALLLNFILPSLYSIEHKYYLYLMFIILVSFNFVFESMLETQAGVVFYAFFNTYLFAIKKDPAPKEARS